MEMRLALSVELRVVVRLWFVATSADYRTISHIFEGISVSGSEARIQGNSKTTAAKIHPHSYWKYSHQRV